jgi:hypothetical protein
MPEIAVVSLLCVFCAQQGKQKLNVGILSGPLEHKYRSD